MSFANDLRYYREKGRWRPSRKKRRVQGKYGVLGGWRCKNCQSRYYTRNGGEIKMCRDCGTEEVKKL